MQKMLEKLGIPEKAAKIYVSLLELGPSTVLDLAERAGVNRPTTYIHLDALKERGLVSTIVKGKRKLFVAESPRELETMLARERKEVEIKNEQLGSLLPELLAMYDLRDDKPIVHYYEGVEGLLKLQAEFLYCKSKLIRGIGSVDAAIKIFPEHKSDYADTRVKNKIHSRFIYSSERGDFLRESNEKMLRETVFVPPEKLPFSADLTIFDDKVAIAALTGKVSGIIIEHKALAESFSGLFDFFWEILQKQK